MSSAPSAATPAAAIALTTGQSGHHTTTVRTATGSPPPLGAGLGLAGPASADRRRPGRSLRARQGGGGPEPGQHLGRNLPPPRPGRPILHRRGGTPPAATRR